MNKLLGHLVVQFREFYRGLTPVKRLSMTASAVIVFIAVAIVGFMVSGSNYVALFTHVPPDQLPTLVDRLQKRGVPFRLQDGGSTILISKDLLHATQMTIMTELGGSQMGQVGLEIFDKQEFGATSYSQKINYQRALQGELMRAINTLNAVRQSKVILALPPKKTFLEEGGQATASVVVELHPGRELAADQVKGITHLVSSAVEGLDPEKVTVVDARGKVLSRPSSSDSGVTAELLDVKQRVERNMEERIEAIIARVVGSGKVIVRVDASLNPRHTVMVQEEVNPESTALKASQSEEELLDGARTNPAGVPGTRANIPGAEDAGQVGFRQNVRKELRTSNFEVPKTVKNIRESAGGIERLSVAVLVDGNRVSAQGENGGSTEEWQPRSQEEMVKLETLVKNAMGFNANRGDSVKIENIQFKEEDFTEAEQLLTTLERRKLVQALLKWSLLGVSLVLFFFLVVRPFMRWITDSFQDSVEDMLPKTIEELEELQAGDMSLPGMSGSLPVLEDAIDPDKAESELLKERIMALLEKDQEKAAGAFSLWLARKES